MDIQALNFPDKSFDKVLSVHVMDFVPDTQKAAAELMRVIKDNGKFAITFPSGKEDLTFGLKIAKGAIGHNLRTRQYLKIPLYLLSLLVATIVYIPFLFRKARRYYLQDEVRQIFPGGTQNDLAITDFSLYDDFIVSKKK